jgi:hypothetical protein
MRLGMHFSASIKWNLQLSRDHHQVNNNISGMNEWIEFIGIKKMPIVIIRAKSSGNLLSAIWLR